MATKPNFEEDAYGRRCRLVVIPPGHQALASSPVRLTRCAIGTLVDDLDRPSTSPFFISDELLRELVNFRADIFK